MLNMTRLACAFDVQTDETFITKNTVKLDRWQDRRAIGMGNCISRNGENVGGEGAGQRVQHRRQEGGLLHA